MGVTLEVLEFADRDGFMERLSNEVSIVLQPSFSESFNFVTVEAAGCGRPFVGSATIRHCPEEWRADPNDPFSIAAVIRRILDDYSAASAKARMVAEETVMVQNAKYRQFVQKIASLSMGLKN
jgi:glycosyltransferase involved in cell wall biosynthesis